jgi:hypothetical protein
MDIFNQTFNVALEKAEGRIGTTLGLWLRLKGNTEGQPFDQPAYFDGLTDDLERPIEWAMPRDYCIQCPHPKWQDQYAITNGKYWVPRKHCRKCEFYRTAKESRRRYATCQYKAKANPVKEAFDTVVSATARAIDLADDIIDAK